MPKDNVYTRIYSYYSVSDLKRGKVVKRIAVNEKTLVKDLFKFIENGAMLDLELIGGKEKTVLSCDKTAKIICEGNSYSTVFDEAERFFFRRIK